MADNIPTWYVQQFSTNIQLLLQQEGSRLQMGCMTGTHVGSQASPVDQINPIAATQVIGRFGPMPRTDALLARRWVFPVDYDLNQLIDSFDKLRLLTDPAAHYVQNAIWALGRSKDIEFLKQVFGTNYVGQDAGSTQNFLTNLTTAGTPGNVVSVLQGAASSTGLTVAKLREGKRRLMQNEVDFKKEPVYCAINSVQHDNLLAEAQVIDADYNGGKPVLEEGLITRFLGVNFIHTELLNTGTDDNSGTSTAVPMWTKMGMYMGNWEDIQTKVSQRDDLQGLPYQAYAKATFGATRLDEKRVIKIWCH